jgi:hypothetical protein
VIAILDGIADGIMRRWGPVLAAREPVASPPHEPGPHAGEPAVPVYDFIPLHAGDGYFGWRPARTDPLVFGPEGAGELQGRTGTGGLFSWCDPCGVRWRGGPACWACGRCP